MIVHRSILFCVALLPMLGFLSELGAQPINEDGRLRVSLRKVGHQILLMAGDSTSRVMPIVQVDDRWKISFEKHFDFDPEEINEITKSVVSKDQLVTRYLVEMEECETGKVVHSFEGKSENDTALMACRGRALPEGCYVLFFTVLEKNEALLQTSSLNSGPSESSESENGLLFYVSLFSLFIILFYILFGRKKKRPELPEHVIALGEFQFDKKNMMLSFHDSQIELTSKETELLILLHKWVNNTVKREVILKDVWGDEGAYIGRTLDVFISKLRKKLEADPNLKIVNIRGIGYKLIVN